MQIYSVTGDWIGFGTIRGEASATSPVGCPDHYASGWQLYVDGLQFGDVYFCRYLGVVIAGSVANKTFTLLYAGCKDILRWKLKYQGGRVGCQSINDDSAWHLSVGGEVKGPDDNPQNLHIDTHFASLEYYRLDYDWWYPWTSLRVYRCRDIGYRLREIAAGDVWVEEQVY